MKNGRDPQWNDPKITSIAAARKKAAEVRKQGAAAKAAGRGGIRELLFGAVIVAMAVGLVVSLTRPLWQGALSFAP